MHTRDEIFNTVKEILVNDFDCDETKIKMESNLVEDLDLDSIDAVDLVVKLQGIINKKVDPEDFKQIRTLQDVVDAVEKIVNVNR
jgi:acyl carrier protein